MNVLILGTNDIRGGASIAAWRLHQGLKGIGVSSRMLVKHKSSDDDSVMEVEGSSELSPFSSIASYVNETARAGKENTLFSVPLEGTDLIAHPWVQQADIINVHWATGFLDPFTLNRLSCLGKPVVWTMHDMRLFTGGCHYDGGCGGFTSGCESCPQLQPALHRLPALALRLCGAAARETPPTIVTPSRWLAHESRRSLALGHCRTEVIPYGIDLETFRPTDKAEARRSLNLPDDALVMTFGALHMQEYRKGFDLMLDALKAVWNQLDDVQRSRMKLTAYGEASEGLAEATGLPITSTGVADSPEKLVTLLSASDAILCPSRQDNLPNVVMEALACGTPVIGYNIGGMPDMVHSGTNGLLVEPLESEPLARALIKIIHQPEALHAWSTQARSLCERDYPLHLQAERYKALFQELLHAPAGYGSRSSDSGFEVVESWNAVSSELLRIASGHLASLTEENRQTARALSKSEKAAESALKRQGSLERSLRKATSTEGVRKRVEDAAAVDFKGLRKWLPSAVAARMTLRWLRRRARNEASVPADEEKGDG